MTCPLSAASSKAKPAEPPASLKPVPADIDHEQGDVAREDRSNLESDAANSSASAGEKASETVPDASKTLGEGDVVMADQGGDVPSSTPVKEKIVAKMEPAECARGTSSLELSFDGGESDSPLGGKPASSASSRVKEDPDPEPSNRKGGKRRTMRKGDVWCAGCASWKAPDQYMVNQKYCSPCKRLLDRIAGQARRQGQDAWFHEQKGNDKSVKSMLDYMRRLVESAGGAGKPVKFAVATFEESQRAEDRTLVRDGGQMMWERQVGGDMRATDLRSELVAFIKHCQFTFLNRWVFAFSKTPTKKRVRSCSAWTVTRKTLVHAQLRRSLDQPHTHGHPCARQETCDKQICHLHLQPKKLF